MGAIILIVYLAIIVVSLIAWGYCIHTAKVIDPNEPFYFGETSISDIV